MSGRNYTLEERDHAVGVALRLGPKEAGRECGIPSSTVRSWLNGRGGKYMKVQEKKLTTFRRVRAYIVPKAQVEIVECQECGAFIWQPRGARPMYCSECGRLIEGVES